MVLGHNINSTAIKFLLQQSHKTRKETREKQNVDHYLTKTPLPPCLRLCRFCTKIQDIVGYTVAVFQHLCVAFMSLETTFKRMFTDCNCCHC